MAKPKNIKCEVVHSRVYLAVEGKLQHVEPGTQLNLPENHRYLETGAVIDASEKKTVDVGNDENAAKKAELKTQIADLKKQAKAEQDANAKAAIESSIKELEVQLKALS